MKLKRVLSTVLAIAMVLTTMGVTVFAADVMPGDSGALVLTEDVTMAGAYSIPANVTDIDLGGFTLTAEGIIAENDVTITNGTLAMPQLNAYGKSVLTISGAANVTLDGVTINAGGGDVAEANNGIKIDTIGNVSILNSYVYGGNIVRPDGSTVNSMRKSAGTAISISNTSAGLVEIVASEIYAGDAEYTGTAYNEGSMQYSESKYLMADGGCAIDAQGGSLSLVDSKVYGGDSAILDAGDGLNVGMAAMDITIMNTEIKGGDCFNKVENRGNGGTAINVPPTAKNPVFVIEKSEILGGAGSGSSAGAAMNLRTEAALDVKESVIKGSTEGNGEGGSAIETASDVVLENVKLEDVEIVAGSNNVAINYGTIIAEVAGNVSITGSTANAAGEEKFAVTNVAEGATLTKKENAEAEPEDVTTTVKKYVAKIDKAMFETLESAVAAAADGETVVVLADADIAAQNAGQEMRIEKNLTIDLNGKSLGFEGSSRFFLSVDAGTTIIKNGKINFSEPLPGDSYMGTGIYTDKGGTLVFENVEMKGNDLISWGYVLYSNNGEMKLDNSTIDVKGGANSSTILFSGVNKGKYVISNSEIKADSIDDVFVNNSVDIDDSAITAVNVGRGLSNIDGTVTNSTVTIDGAVEGIYTSGHYNKKLTFEGEKTVVNITNSEKSDILLNANEGVTTEINVENKATLIASNVDEATAGKITNDGGNVILRTDNITVKFVDATVDENNNSLNLRNPDGSIVPLHSVYDIILVADTDKQINRLTAAELVFDFEGNEVEGVANRTPVSYEILKVDKVDLATDTKVEGRYLFHFDGEKAADSAVANQVKIAQVKFSGYGHYTFKVVENKTGDNMAHATAAVDNIVDTYVVGGGTAANVGKLVIEDAKLDDTILVPTQDLTINIAFPNAINANDKEYQDMKVTISGGDLVKDIVVELGNGAEWNGTGYTVVVKDVLSQNTAYTVTVAGAGYRTAKYTVNMQETDKELNFWNNVKTTEEAIEEGKTPVVSNFLAGDIVKDNDINIYDLSAVVSYFGEVAESRAAEWSYAKYDLNRDGEIDSKDVAYVLVSWRN